MTEQRTSTGNADACADKAMHEIWREWFSFYERHFRAPHVKISMADQQAFYEIAQPILRRLASVLAQQTPGRFCPKGHVLFPESNEEAEFMRLIAERWLFPEKFDRTEAPALPSTERKITPADVLNAMRPRPSTDRP